MKKCLCVGNITMELSVQAFGVQNRRETPNFYRRGDKQFQDTRNKHQQRDSVKSTWGTRTRLSRALLNQISSICALVSQAHV